MVNRAVQLLLGAVLDRDGDAPPGPIPLRSDAAGSAAWLEDAAVALVNAAVGDHLRGRTAELDLGLRLRHGDAYLPDRPLPRDDRPAIVLLVHGLGTTEWCWALDGAARHGDPATTFGTLLQADLGLEPVYVRYNTGRPVAVNGAALADRLEALAEAWDPARIVLVGHSMGGLVARAACAAGERAGHRWIRALGDVVSLGTPHQGAPLAAFAEVTTRALGGVDLPATRVLGRILAARSRGVHDLAEGGAEPLLPGVRHAFLAATVTADPAHPVGDLVGDLLVRVVSAAGPEDLERVTETLGGVPHHRMQCDPAVYAVVRRILATGAPP